VMLPAPGAALAVSGQPAPAGDGRVERR
jgi:hypothetical protein